MRSFLPLLAFQTVQSSLITQMLCIPILFVELAPGLAKGVSSSLGFIFITFLILIIILLATYILISLGILALFPLLSHWILLKTNSTPPSLKLNLIAYPIVGGIAAPILGPYALMIVRFPFVNHPFDEQLFQFPIIPVIVVGSLVSLLNAVTLNYVFSRNKSKPVHVKYIR